MNKNIKLVEYIVNFINSNLIFKNSFNHHNQIYHIDKLLLVLLHKLETGLSYRNISNLYFNIKGGTLRYFHQKIIKLKIFEEFYNTYITKYLEEINYINKNFYVDTTLIANKLGIDSVTYNVQLNKHKSSKISIIIDDFDVPINYITCDSNTHDSTILCNQIDDVVNKFPKLCTNDKNFIADGAYDSNKIRNLLEEKKLGVLICNKNIRNTKNKVLINKSKHVSLYNKILLKRRIKIEHTNCSIKKNITINNRYIKYMENFNNYVLLSLIKISFNIIGQI